MAVTSAVIGRSPEKAGTASSSLCDLFGLERLRPRPRQSPGRMRASAD
ncbi:hypothetical protein [Streptomyces sp. NPDC020983]